MRSINKVILIGNLTRDPEMRSTPSGQNVVTFGIATNREWITKDGRKQNSAEYHDLVAWAKLADICQKYLKKGKLVYVEGYLKTRSWDTPEGTKKFRTEIVVQDMIMLDKKNDSEDYYPEEEVTESSTAKKENTETEEPKDQNEEVESSEKEELTEKRAQSASAQQDEEAALPDQDEAEPTDKNSSKKTLDIDSDLGL